MLLNKETKPNQTISYNNDHYALHVFWLDLMIILIIIFLPQLTGAAEYTNCIRTEG